MPTSLPGLAIFLCLLVPGFMFVVQYESNRKRKPQTVLRETVEFVLASFFALTASLLLIAAVWVFIDESLSPNVKRAFTKPGDEWKAEYASICWWGLAWILLACFMAFALGRWGGRLIENVSPSYEDLSPFAAAVEGALDDFDGEVGPDDKFLVTCHLSTGRVVRGVLDTYATDPDEPTKDRVVVLAPPILAGTGEELTAWGTGKAIIEFDSIEWIHVEFGTPPILESDEAAESPSAADA